jgi:hypothetical protein
MHSMLLRSTLAMATLRSVRAPRSRPAVCRRGHRSRQARASFLGPTGEYPLPGGGTRLEFARGAHGKQTYMLDFDAAGSLVLRSRC